MFLCQNPLLDFSLGRHRRTVAIYLAGGLFALTNWTFLNAAILSKHAKTAYNSAPDSDPPVRVTFVDWIPAICTPLGYLVVNLVDKDGIRGEEGFGASRAVRELDCSCSLDSPIVGMI